MSVYLAINNTDVSGTALVIEFADEAELKAWQERIDELTGSDTEPFGFRAECGVAYRILSPDDALALIPAEKRKEPNELPTPGTRGSLVGRLIEAPTVRIAPGGRVAKVRVAARKPVPGEYVLIVFGANAEALARLSAGRSVYVEGRWQARQGAPELIADLLNPLMSACSEQSTT